MALHTQSLATEQHHGAQYVSCRSTPLGEFTLLSDGRHILGAYFDGQKHFPQRSAAWRADSGIDVFLSAWAQIDEYFRGNRRGFDLPLHAHGTPFQLRVWAVLKEIEFGETLTYGNLAISLGNPRAVRAVGAAVGRNPHSILVPCHRVVGSTGRLTGYAGGLDRKSVLLSLEARHS